MSAASVISALSIFNSYQMKLINTIKTKQRLQQALGFTAHNENKRCFDVLLRHIGSK